MTVTSARHDPAASVLGAGHRLAAVKGADFTIHELVDEAGISLQTFYRYFGGKDQLLVALIADQISEHCRRLTELSVGITDPVERFLLFVRSTVQPLADDAARARARFIATETWRLHQLLPERMAIALQPFADLVRVEIEAASAAGSLAPRNADSDAWLVTKTAMGAFHHWLFLPDDPVVRNLADDVCAFCLAAVGGAQRPVPRTVP